MPQILNQVSFFKAQTKSNQFHSVKGCANDVQNSSTIILNENYLDRNLIEKDCINFGKSRM